jgi:hypothetical protein
MLSVKWKIKTLQNLRGKDDKKKSIKKKIIDLNYLYLSTINKNMTFFSTKIYIF